MFDRKPLNMPEVLETSRLTIRTPRPGDGAALNAAYCASKDRLEPWFPWAQKDFTVEEHEALMREKHADFISQNDFMLAIIEKESGTFIGGTGLHFRSRDPLIFEIGYWLRTGYEGKGYVSEVVRKLTIVGFETLSAEKILIRADEDNLRSQAVAKRCGYHYDGTMRWYERRQNDREKMINMTFFSLLPDEFEHLMPEWNRLEGGS